MLCELLDTPLEKFHFSVSLHNFLSKIRRKKSDWFLNGLLLHLIRLNLSLSHSAYLVLTVGIYTLHRDNLRNLVL